MAMVGVLLAVLLLLPAQFNAEGFQLQIQTASVIQPNSTQIHHHQQQQQQQQEEEQQEQRQQEQHYHTRLLQQLQLRQQQPSCPKNGTRRCGQRCVRLADPAACGPACVRCPRPPANGLATCSISGACGVSCARGYERVRGQAVCRLCRANTFKPAAGAGPCITCPAGTLTRRQQQPPEAAHDEAIDCVTPVSCPPGQQADPTTLTTCSVCPSNTWKDRDGPGPCLPCSASTVAPGPTAEDHDSNSDCLPISCPKGMQRILDGPVGGCRPCPANTWRATPGPDPCLPCPAGTFTIGDEAANHDESQDCYQMTCPPGTQLNVLALQCSPCPDNTFKLGTNTDNCTACPDGTVTLGNTAKDHDELGDCLAGGLQGAPGNTRSMELAVDYFDMELERSLNNTGGRSTGGKGGSRPPRGRRMTACLFECDGVDGDPTFSFHVAHLAGAPAVFYSPNRVSAVRDQRSCGTCVTHAIASAAESAVAAALRIDARGPKGLTLSHSFSYFCTGYYIKAGGARSCNTGWSFEAALAAMAEAPAVFFMNSSCLGQDPAAGPPLSDAAMSSFCRGVPDTCKSPSFRCSYKRLSDGISQLQRYIRRHGSVITRIRVTDDFTQFFRANPTGVYSSNDTTISGRRSFLHAVQLIGYNNEERFFLAKNSVGAAWGDEGLFRIGYGVAEVGHPEDTYTLLDCFTTSNDTAVVAAWSDRWSLQPDLGSTDDCFIYEANEGDTISGIVDHFQVGILPFIDANTRRGVIKTRMLGEPARPEPQLQPETTWAGFKFQVCNIPEEIFDRVAEDPCTATPNYCNSRQTSCVAGRCVCPARFAGRFCEQDLGVQLNLTVAGQLHVLHLEPRLPWIDAQKRCERDGLRLARLFSRLHAIEVQRQVRQIRGKVHHKMWIGLSDRQQEGRFEWVGADSGSGGGVVPGFGMWKDWQPDDFQGDEDCVEMWWTGHSLDYPFWNDLPCTQAEAFLCTSVEESTDPCVTHPCSFAGSRPVGCVSAGVAAAAGSYGRQCLCEAPLEYVSDELGCVEPLKFDSFSFELAGTKHMLFVEPESSWTEAARIC